METFLQIASSQQQDLNTMLLTVITLLTIIRAIDRFSDKNK